MLSSKISKYIRHTAEDDELTKYNNIFDDEVKNFDLEQELNSLNKGNTNLLDKMNCEDSVKNIIFNHLDKSDVILEYELKDISTRIFLNNNIDVVNNIYLEISLNSLTFDELYITDKNKLFNITVILSYSEYSATINILETNLLSSLFMMISRGLNIKSSNNIIHIPLLDFNITKLAIHDAKSKIILNGLLSTNATNIKIDINNDLVIDSRFNFKILVKGQIFNISDCYKYGLCDISCLFLMSRSCVSKYNNKIHVKNASTQDLKAIIFYFEPISEYVEYPRISSINFYYKDKNMYYDSSELLEMTMFDITCMVLPLSKDFDSWDNINKCLSDPYNYFTNDAFEYERERNNYNILTTLNIDIEYEADPENFILHYNLIASNILSKTDGKYSITNMNILLGKIN